LSAENLGPCPEHFNLLCGALDHIARTARASRSQTRRIRWIEARALGALRGEPYQREAIDLPINAGPNTPEKLHKRLAVQRQINKELVQAAEQAMAALLGTPAGRGLAVAILNAKAPGGVDHEDGAPL
jgi:hypothetical protein